MLPNDKLRITKAFLEVIQEELATSQHVYETEKLIPVQQQTLKFHDILITKQIERDNTEKLLYKNITKH